MDDRTLRRFRRSLSHWYTHAARDLPWRRTRDPYAIWISEIMLQQTTVAAVVPYYERFLSRFPTLQDLAAADEHDVLRLWEGLGYYSRARNLLRAARDICTRHAGLFPTTPDALAELPGIGRYTAGAIASFAFDKPAPIVEANTLRLYARLMGYREDPRSSSGQSALWDFAAKIVPRTAPGRFNQALMELGATLCTPASPACEQCPVKSCCQAFAQSLQAEIPVPPSRPEITDLTHAAVVVHARGRWLLRQYAAGERWAGLWDFPRFELPADAVPARQSRHADEIPSRAIQKHLNSRVRELTGVEVESGRLFHQLRHSVTRYRIRLLCFDAKSRKEETEAESTPNSNRSNVRWVTPAELAEIPLPVTGRKIATLLSSCSEISP